MQYFLSEPVDYQLESMELSHDTIPLESESCEYYRRAQAWRVHNDISSIELNT